MAAQELRPTAVATGHRGTTELGLQGPDGQWFRGPLLHLLRSIVLSKQALARGYFNEARLREMIEEHCAGRRDHDKQLWILLQLELWHLMFIDRTLTPSDRLV